ncbi:MAG: YtxH domain-containing protein [Myxococcota bacterium]|nr:YtxH domain-containing protein [Myxococcota bacterium]
MKKFARYDIEDVLDLVGLARRRSVMGGLVPAIGLVALGAIVGAGVGLVCAPSSGRRLRKDVGERLEQMRERMKSESQKRGTMNSATSVQS